MVRTTAINKLLAMKARKKIVQGGTSAGKTHGIIPILIDKACKSRLKITVVSETIAAVRGGAVDIFMQVTKETNRWRPDGWIGSPMEYEFVNGSRIQFKAFDTVGKAKSAGKRDILFINEANNIPYEIADALMIRSKETWIDFNADVEFWAHTELLTEPNSELLILTYHDNEAIPEETLENLLIKRDKAFIDVDGNLDDGKNIKSVYWANWWNVYGRGKIGNVSELRVMPPIYKCDNVPNDSVEIPSALDFGWLPDPTCFCRLFIRTKNVTGKLQDELYIKPIVYGTKLSIDASSTSSKNLCTMLVERGVNKNHLTISECADPRAIHDMKEAGFSIEAVRKIGVEASIRKFHDYEIYIVDDGSEEFKSVWNEFDNFKYARDKETNEITRTPKEGQADHGISGVRYVLLSRGMRWSV